MASRVKGRLAAQVNNSAIRGALMRQLINEQLDLPPDIYFMGNPNTEAHNKKLYKTILVCRTRSGLIRNILDMSLYSKEDIKTYLAHLSLFIFRINSNGLWKKRFKKAHIKESKYFELVEVTCDKLEDDPKKVYLNSKDSISILLVSSVKDKRTITKVE